MPSSELSINIQSIKSNDVYLVFPYLIILAMIQTFVGVQHPSQFHLSWSSIDAISQCIYHKDAERYLKFSRQIVIASYNLSKQILINENITLINSGNKQYYEYEIKRK